MAASYKYFGDNDKVVVNNELTSDILNEKGTEWVSASYSPYYFLQVASGSDIFPLCDNVFDVTFGRSSTTLTSSTSDFQAEKNIYNQFAKVLLGHNSDGTIKKFNLNDTTVLHNAYFVNFSRCSTKDKIRQGSFELILNASGSVNISLVDKDSTVKECATGYYAPLYASSSNTTDFNITDGINDIQGLVFYEAGVAVVSPYIFAKSGSNDNPSSDDTYVSDNTLGILVSDANNSLSGSNDIGYLVTSGSILNNAVGLTSQVLTASFQSVTELNSSIYFCRAYNHEFNYSSNPTYLQSSKIVVKGDNPEALPRTYITTVGLYSDDNQLLAVAKLSEPVLKTPENELIARVRIDW